MAGQGTSITDLFLEYLRAHEENRVPDEADLLERAGSRIKELQTRIEAFESIRGLGDQLRNDGARVPAVTSVFGRFEILELLAEGGMGTVYLAQDQELGRLVALKLLHPLMLGEHSSRDMILNEARSLARLEHPGVVEIHQIDRRAGRDYIVMEYVPGPSLADVIERLRGAADERPDKPLPDAQPALTR